MVNTEKFAERLNKILDYYDLSAAAFADKIEVGRSSISHILSGRNKPSLDFVMKVVKNFPEVELYWLLNGRGNFPFNKKTQDKSFVESRNTKNTQEIESVEQKTIPYLIGDSAKKISKIVIFYKDGSFDAFEN